ncbi:MAG: DTW domain-containing protein, partial [Candidatus Sericytochromatia bacterium]
KEFKKSSNKPTAFILIDGTWNQARKIFRKSTYLDKLPMLSLNIDKKSQYLLRRASQDTHLCTAEVGIELLRLNEEFEACDLLDDYFKRFIESYVSGRTNGIIKKLFEDRNL